MKSFNFSKLYNNITNNTFYCNILLLYRFSLYNQNNPLQNKLKSVIKNYFIKQIHLQMNSLISIIITIYIQNIKIIKILLIFKI